MAVNESRSLNGDLAAGISDGSVKKLTPDRGGQTDDDTVRTRNSNLQQQYNARPMYDDYTSAEVARRVTTVHG